MLHFETIDPSTFELLRWIQSEPLFSGLNLVGAILQMQRNKCLTCLLIKHGKKQKTLSKDRLNRNSSDLSQCQFNALSFTPYI